VQSCEVLIVGGGPAGSSCAARLVDAGLDVALIDRATFPRDKVCAGWITPAVIRTLQLDLDDYGRCCTLQPFTGFRTGSLSGHLRLHDFGTTVSYGIRRCEFDDYLLRRSGVRRIEGAGVRELRRDRTEWIVNDTIRARMLIGAGGHFCPVARSLNRDVADAPAIVAQEIEFELDDRHAASCGVAGTAPELFFWPDLAGYAWCVRKGPVLNVGAGRLAPWPLPPAMRQFAALLAERGGIFDQTLPRWKGHAYLLNRASTRRLHSAGVLLVGDSAGLALTPSGEGILSAIESGVMAAVTVLAARGDYSESRLAPYAGQIRDRFGARAAGIRSVPAWMSAIASKALLGFPALTRRVLLEDGFLHTRRPDLCVAA